MTSVAISANGSRVKRFLFPIFLGFAATVGAAENVSPFKAEIDRPGNTLGAAAGHLPRANEIYVGWKKYPFAKLRIGQLKPAFGAEQQDSDLRGMTIERSLASDRISDGRQIGLRVGGDLPGGWLNYTLFIANGNGANSSANDNSKFARSARVVLTARKEKEQKLLFGVGGFWTDDDGVSKSGLGLAGNLFTGRRAGWGVDAEWRAGTFELTGELLQSRFQPRGAAEFEARGWHLTAGDFLLPRQLQAVVRRETFDPNTAVDGNDARSRTFGLNHFIKGDELAVKTNYLVGRSPGAIGDAGRLVTRLQVVF